jgi:hypothetical protein
LGLNPLPVGVCAAAGSVLSPFSVIFVGGRLRGWLPRRYNAKKERKHPGLIKRIWLRYGLIGLGLLAPLLTGAPLGAALGLSLGAQTRPLMIWMSLGIIIWTAILTIVGTMGLSAIENLF